MCEAICLVIENEFKIKVEEEEEEKYTKNIFLFSVRVIYRAQY